MASPRWADVEDDDNQEIDFETYQVFYLFFNFTQNTMLLSTATELSRSFTDEMLDELYGLIAGWMRLQGRTIRPPFIGR